MTTDAASLWALMCLRVESEPDPSILTRLLGYFQNLNITPRRVVAEFSTHGHLYLQVEVGGLSEERMGLITAKASQLPVVIDAHWHPL